MGTKSGALNALNGGDAFVAALVAGEQAGATGKAYGDGKGSSIEISGSGVFGRSGNGTLQLTHGATEIAADLVLGAQTSGTGLLDLSDTGIKLKLTSKVII